MAYKTVQVNPDGKAPKGLSAGTVVKTAGGDFAITKVNKDGSYESSKVTNPPTRATGKQVVTRPATEGRTRTEPKKTTPTSTVNTNPMVAGIVNANSNKTTQAPIPEWQRKLNTYKTDKTAAQNEIIRVKQVYMNEASSGATPERLKQISTWADQVRAAAGLNNAVYGANATLETAKSGIIPQPVQDPLMQQSSSPYESESLKILRDVANKMNSPKPYDDAYNKIMSLYENRAKPISQEEARKQATEKVNADYSGIVEQKMAQMDSDAARRGFYGQLPTEALKRARAMDIETNKQRDIVDQASKILQQSSDDVDKQNQLKTNMMMQALQMAQSGDQNQIANAMALANFVAGRGDTKFSQGVQMAGLTGELPTGEKTLTGKEFDMREEKFELDKKIINQQLKEGDIKLERLTNPESPENQVRLANAIISNAEANIAKAKAENFTEEQKLALEQEKQRLNLLKEQIKTQKTNRSKILKSMEDADKNIAQLTFGNKASIMGFATDSIDSTRKALESAIEIRENDLLEMETGEDWKPFGIGDDKEQMEAYKTTQDEIKELKKSLAELDDPNYVNSVYTDYTEILTNNVDSKYTEGVTK